MKLQAKFDRELVRKVTPSVINRNGGRKKSKWGRTVTMRRESVLVFKKR